MADIKVSIIIPSYNEENHIKKCIESLIKQSLQEIEIIIVNDGSTDNTLDIIIEYASEDPRIVVINQSNKGVSAARNRGIDEARGTYLAFVDADDYVDETIYEVMYNKAIDKYSDIVVCGNYIMQYNKMEKKISFDSEITLDNDNIDLFNFIKKFYLKKEYRTSCWNKLYKTELIKGKISFCDHSNVLSEDTLFNFNVLLYTKRVTIIPECLYFYQVIDGSLSHSKKFINVAMRNSNQINKMYELTQNNNNESIKTLVHYYYLQGLSNIAELEINHNGNTFKGLTREISLYRSKKQSNININKHNNVLKIIESKQKSIYYFLLNFFNQLNSNFLLAIILLLKTKKRMTLNDY